MSVTASDIVLKFVPKAKDVYEQAFAGGTTLLQQYGITTPLRLAHFMAQCLHETGALTILIESGRYSEKALARMWDEWQVQEKLNALGYSDVKPDGVVGPKTKTAILDYRIKHGLAATPAITPDLLLSPGIS